LALTFFFITVNYERNNFDEENEFAKKDFPNGNCIFVFLHVCLTQVNQFKTIEETVTKELHSGIGLEKKIVIQGAMMKTPQQYGYDEKK